MCSRSNPQVNLNLPTRARPICELCPNRTTWTEPLSTRVSKVKTWGIRVLLDLNMCCLTWVHQSTTETWRHRGSTSTPYQAWHLHVGATCETIPLERGERVRWFLDSFSHRLIVFHFGFDTCPNLIWIRTYMWIFWKFGASNEWKHKLERANTCKSH